MSVGASTLGSRWWNVSGGKDIPGVYDTIMPMFETSYRFRFCLAGQQRTKSGRITNGRA